MATIYEPYVFDKAAWDAWVAETDRIRYSNRGKPAPAVDASYRDVLFEHFGAYVADDTSVKGNLFAPTHPWICVDAKAPLPSQSTNYVYSGGALSLRLQHVGGHWTSGMFTTINSTASAGRVFGKGLFEIRCRFPKLSAPRPGFFPAFWAYGIEQMYSRDTRNRLETDFFEYDGLNGAYINISQHVHKPGGTGPWAPDVITADVRKKIAGYEIGPATGFPARIDIYDGQFHTWRAQIEDDLTYFVLDGRELARCPTSKELAAQKYILVDWAYRAYQGAADPAQTYDMTIDYIRVRQRGIIAADSGKGP